MAERRRKHEIKRVDERIFLRDMKRWLDKHATHREEPYSPTFGSHRYTMQTKYGELNISLPVEHRSSYTVCTRFERGSEAHEHLPYMNAYSGKWNFHLPVSCPPWDAAADIIKSLEGVRA